MATESSSLPEREPAHDNLEEEQPPATPWAVMGSDEPLHLVDDPWVAVAINDQHRRADVPDGAGSDLWSVDQWRGGAPRAYRFVAPTFAPLSWSAAMPIGQADYSRAFAKEFPELGNILPMRHVCVAGGAAAWPLGEPFHKAGDIDFFLYGLPADESAASRDARWLCVAQLLAKIRDQFYMCTETLTVGLISIKAYRKHESEPIKLQIILRAYFSVSAILHGFDIPSCCVAYDGLVACMTYLAAYAHMFRVNVVVPAYRSTTYESRLLKYFGRGYALALPHMRCPYLVRGEPTVLPNLILVPSLVRGRFAVGAASLPAAQPESDYDREPRRRSPGLAQDICRHAQPNINLRMLATDKPFVVMAIAGARRSRGRRLRRGPDEIEPGLQFGTELTQSAVFPRAQLEHALQTAARALVTRRGHVNLMALRQVFGFNADQATRLGEAIAEAYAANPGRRIDVSQSLAAACAALLAKYDARSEAIAWWILADPTRQHTASLNPRCEDPAQWYGAAYADIGPPTIEERMESIVGAYEGRLAARCAPLGTAFDGICLLCHDEVRRGDVNSITLGCGHVFHWSTLDGGCVGLCPWTMQSRTCPACRAPFGDDDLESDATSEVGEAPVVVAVML
jgi:hypothetical protein